MREFQSILSSYYEYKAAGIQAALATVVKVEGSSYRRPGARMLVSSSGKITGAISGGCLEGDALRKAQAVMFTKQSMLAIYDTTDEDDQKFGLGLGCNGIIYVLIEPLDYTNPYNPVILLEKAIEKRVISRLLTVFSTKKTREVQIGTVMLARSDDEIFKQHFIPENIQSELNQVLSRKSDIVSKIVPLNGKNDLEVFIEFVPPTLRVVLFGAGNDTIPLAKMIDILDWSLILVDGRKQYASPERFPSAQQIVVATADEAVDGLSFDYHTVVLLMTHNFDYEKEVLRKLIGHPLPYIGILGPQKKSEKLLSFFTTEERKLLSEKIFGPVGLNIGAEGSEEIALAILAEIKAVLNRTQPYSLKLKSGPIHG
ncbi:XdhC family protein [Belliella kenyensis]|uniref:XdhC family protein n=1 Tax=Belliella kenyensis TaxID=1472724 RepID=A0ABV8EJ63_9BACT|nr:XdhC/CoxI family protein [Belliella kenyensis]MCH7400407.1 XdhC family protein [Belliella kenyensis]MDN3604576.1 XdhC family protein [Belliella kenyensis]